MHQSGHSRAAEHADRAVLLEQRDHAAAARGELGLDVGVLLGDGRLGQGLERDGETLDKALAGRAALPVITHKRISCPVARCDASTPPRDLPVRCAEEEDSALGPCEHWHRRPAHSDGWTTDDLEALPRNGVRRELLEACSCVAFAHRIMKPALYAAAGIRHYWRFETDGRISVHTYRIRPRHETYLHVSTFETRSTWPSRGPSRCRSRADAALPLKGLTLTPCQPVCSTHGFHGRRT